MNKFKKILLGAVSVLTLGLFVVTGNTVKAADITYDFTHYNSDTCYSNEACTTKLKVSSVGTANWYEKKTVSNEDLVINGFSSAVRMNNSNGLIDRMGNTPGFYSSLDSKYQKSEMGDNNADTYYGMVFGIKAIENVDEISVSFKNIKGQDSGKAEYHVLVTSDNTTYTSLYSAFPTKDATFNVSLSVTEDSGEYFANYDQDHFTSLGTSDTLGYAILIVGSKNIQVDLWNTSITVKHEGDLAEYHNIYYHDVNGNVIESLTQDAEENSNSKVPHTSAEAPVLLGMNFVSWNIGSIDGEPVGNTIAMGTEDVHLYASYSADPDYSVDNQNKLDQAILKYSFEKKNNALTYDMSFANTIYKAQSGTQFKSGNTTVSGKAFTHYIDTIGKATATEKGLVISAPSAGYLVVYLKNGSSSEKTINLFHEDSLTKYLSDMSLAGNEAKRIVLSIPGAGNYRLGGNDSKIYIYEVEFTTEQPISTPILEQQETSDGSAVRYIATVSNVSDIDDIVSWTAKLTVDSKVKSLDDQTAVYTAVGGTNGKTAADNTYYLVVTLKNIPASYNGKELSCEFTIKLSNEQIIATNKVTYTINVTA